MSVGRTNSGSGGGGISSNSALLVVYAPLGSTVTATNGGTTKNSRQGIALSDRPTVEMHLISIGSSQFGTWTVTATRGTDTNSTTISVTAVERYELYIGYHVPIGEYQEVEYLEGTGTQFIRAGIASANVDGYEADYQYTTLYSGNNLYGILGGRYANTNAWCDIVHWAGNISITPSDYSYPIDTNRHVAKCGAGFDWVTTFDGTVVSTTHSDLPTNVDTLDVFATRQRATNTYSDRISACKIFSAKFYLGTAIQREFYPCYRLSDSVAGLYDKANGVFYTNSGSGTFTVGADVS